MFLNYVLKHFLKYEKIALFFIFGAIMGCEKQVGKEMVGDCVEKIKPDIVCTAQYDPVCGCNNITYGNACTADAMSIRIVYKGECKK